MKNYITPSYTFTPGASGVGTIDTNIVNFDVKLLVAIVNQTRNTIIYGAGLTGRGYTNLSGDILTLEFNTTGHNSADVLQFIYDNTTDYRGFVDTGLTQPLTDAQLRASSVGVSTIGTTPITTNYTNTGVIAINTVLIGPIDCINTSFLKLSSISVGTTGGLTTQWADDLAFTNPVTAQLVNVTTGALLTTAIGSNTYAQTGIFGRYFRVIMGTATTAGTTNINVTQTLGQPNFIPSSQAINVASGSQINLTTSTILQDITSATISASATTTGNITSVVGTSYSVAIPVTAISGTPTLDVSIEESDNTGADWFKVYDFPRISGTGIYRSPKLPYFGNRIRYVQTLNGTTSFTRSVQRMMYNDTTQALRQLINRTIVLTTLNSTTPNLDVRNTKNIQLVINVGAITTTAPQIQLEGSDDNGTTVYNIGSPITAVANSTVQVTNLNIKSQLVRARVSTAGVGVTAGYVLIKAFN
jgi:hypothetical protein